MVWRVERGERGERGGEGGGRVRIGHFARMAWSIRTENLSYNTAVVHNPDRGQARTNGHLDVVAKPEP